MIVQVYLEKQHGNHALVYYIGEYAVLYEITYDDELPTFLNHVKLGLKNKRLLSMERKAFDERYDFVFKATIEVKNEELFT